MNWKLQKPWLLMSPSFAGYSRKVYFSEQESTVACSFFLWFSDIEVFKKLMNWMLKNEICKYR